MFFGECLADTVFISKWPQLHLYCMLQKWVNTANNAKWALSASYNVCRMLYSLAFYLMTTSEAGNFYLMTTSEAGLEMAHVASWKVKV